MLWGIYTVDGLLDFLICCGGTQSLAFVLLLWHAALRELYLCE